MFYARVCAVAAILLTAVAAPAHERVYETKLSGANMSPPVTTGGAGAVHVVVDLDLVTIHIEVEFSGLSGPATAARIHGLTEIPFEGDAASAVVDPTLPDFPIGVSFGDYHHELSLGLASTFSPGFIAANGGTVATALNALLSGLEEGRIYFQIDSAAFPGGEIRGFLMAHGLPGDMNCDEVVSVGDIGGFVLALTNPEAYQIQFPDCDLHNADLNDDHAVSVGDIGLFVEALTG